MLHHNILKDIDREEKCENHDERHIIQEPYVYAWKCLLILN